MTAGPETGEIRFDQKRRDAFAASFGISFGENDKNAGYTAIGNPGFGAVKFVHVAVARGAGLDACGIGAGLWLGEAEGAEAVSYTHLDVYKRQGFACGHAFAGG